MQKKLILTYTIITIFGLLLASTSTLVKAEVKFNLQITNLSGETLNFTNEQLFAMPKTTIYSELYCDGSLLISGNWAGISLNYLLAQANATQEVVSLQFTASDGYKSYLPYELAVQPDTIIAYELDDAIITENLRLVLPGCNGAAWIAMINSITMSTSEVNYPEGITAGFVENVIKNVLGPSPGLPAEAQSTPQPPFTTPTNSSSTQVDSPANVTIPNLVPPKQNTSENEEIPIETVFLAIAIVSITVLLAAGYLKHKHKVTNK